MSERALSHWAWGYVDRFPDEEALRALASQLEAVLGFAAQAPEAPAPLEALRLPPPRLMPPAALLDLVTPATEARVRHTYGKAYRDQLRALRGDFRAAPDLVALPGSEEDVARVLEWADGAGVAVVPFGGGTSVVQGLEIDGPERFPATLSLDLTRLDRVLEVDATSRLARIQAGARGPVLERGLATHGLSLRFFPQSFELSTLGGWVATRAGGHFATLTTHIDALVASVRVLSPAGLIATRTLPASGAGPSPDRLVLGSEGALGVITEATVRVRPRPRFRAGATARFCSFAAGAEAARALAQSDLHPSNCRLLDEREAALNGVTSDGSAVLLLAFESDDHPLDAWLLRALALVREHGGRVDEERAGASSEDGREGWRRAFLEAPYLQSVLLSLGVVADTFETACPWSRFPSLHAEVVARVRAAMRAVAGAGRLTCRLTHVHPDGPAPYYTFLFPARRGAELEQWAEVKAAASEAVLEAGGTITHHHAVGRTHRRGYEREVPEPMRQALWAAKRALDPRGVMNPGVLLGEAPERD
jgi:alkyldihydroxyacetonephosphate synthase